MSCTGDFVILPLILHGHTNTGFAAPIDSYYFEDTGKLIPQGYSL